MQLTPTGALRGLGPQPPVRTDIGNFATCQRPGDGLNAIDWASRPRGQNSFDHIPAAVIGASIGQIGTALSQQSLRAVLSFCNARQMTAPEAYIQYTPQLFPGNGDVTDQSVVTFLTNFMAEFHDHIVRVLTVLPRHAQAAPA